MAVRSPQVEGAWHRGHVPDGPRSIFEIGSITKVFTATLLADMAREGLVALDDPVQKWLPEGMRMPQRGRPITLEDLTTHRSGLPRLPHGLLLPALTRDRRDPYARLDPARLEAAIPRTRPRNEPGERSRYSNYAVGLLGYLLARRAGMSYERLVRARICEPLGLADTWVQTPVADRGRVATPHDRWGRETGHWHLAALAGAGGLRSTAPDLLAFLALHAGRASAASSRRRARRTGRAPTPGGPGSGSAGSSCRPGRASRSAGCRPRCCSTRAASAASARFAAVVPSTGASVVVLANQVRSVTRLGLQVLRQVV